MLTLFAKSPFSKYVDGIRISVRAVSANTAAASFNVNGVGSKPIYCVGIAGIAPVGAGQIQAGGIYDFVYCSALADNAGGWFLLNPSQTQVVSPGFMQIMTSPIAPAGYLYCNGQAVSRTTYAALFAVIGGWWARAMAAQPLTFLICAAYSLAVGMMDVGLIPVEALRAGRKTPTAGMVIHSLVKPGEAVGTIMILVQENALMGLLS